MSVFFEMKVGGGAGAGARTEYDTRLPSTRGELDRVWTQNVPDYVMEIERAGDREMYKELRANLSEFMRQREEDERDRGPRREDDGGRAGGGGKGTKNRTFYRLIYSFHEGASPAQVKRMVAEHQRECFPRNPVVNSLHGNTGHHHVHSVVAARGTDGLKLHMGWKTYREIDERWAAIYGREFGEEFAREHLEKKEERREHRRAALAARLRGEPVPPRPEREAHRRNRLRERLKTAERESGVVRRADEQGITGRDRRAEAGSRTGAGEGEGARRGAGGPARGTGGERGALGHPAGDRQRADGRAGEPAVGPTGARTDTAREGGRGPEEHGRRARVLGGGETVARVGGGLGAGPGRAGGAREGQPELVGAEPARRLTTAGGGIPETGGGEFETPERTAGGVG